MSKKQTSMPAGRVLQILEEKHFAKGAYEMLREVRDSTGGGASRSADALVVSCWPSRGIWFGGIEVKVSRSDWLSELRNPRKSAEIQRFCSYWWIATPEGIVKPEELPETWGHFEVAPGSVKLVRAAPKLEAEAPTPGFVASIFRNQADQDARRREADYRRGYREAEEKYDGQDLEQLKRSVELATGYQRSAEARFAALQDQVFRFERDTGFSFHSRQHSAVEQFRKAQGAVQALEHCNLVRMAEVLRNTADALAVAHDSLSAAKAVSDAAE